MSGSESAAPLGWPSGSFSVVYADPPWNGLGWNNGSGKKCPARHYQVMSDEDIMRLPVASICAENAALFLWVTFPNLPLGLRVIDAWGFRYATQAFTWVKRTKHGKLFWGCGNYTRANAEVCLLGVRGTMKRQSASVLSVVDATIGRHSAKPTEVRDRIVRLMGDVPRVELFARGHAPEGWTVWGNEVEANNSLTVSPDAKREANTCGGTGSRIFEPYDGIPCVCTEKCHDPCKGRCGCKACRTTYQDFLSNE